MALVNEFVMALLYPIIKFQYQLGRYIYMGIDGSWTHILISL